MHTLILDVCISTCGCRAEPDLSTRDVLALPAARDAKPFCSVSSNQRVITIVICSASVSDGSLYIYVYICIYIYIMNCPKQIANIYIGLLYFYFIFYLMHQRLIVEHYNSSIFHFHSSEML